MRMAAVTSEGASVGLSMEPVVSRASGRPARFGRRRWPAKSSGIRQRRSGQGGGRSHGTQDTTIQGPKWGDLLLPLDVVCQIVNDRICPILRGGRLPRQVRSRLVKLGDQPATLNDHGG